jgi:RNA recognition motif-containing protein
MAVRLFVRNLPYHTTEAELREHFSVIGQISYLALPTDRETGKPRGFAFLEFNNPAEAEEAIRRFNNQIFKGRPLSVSKALPKEDRPQSNSSNRPARPQYQAVSEPDIAAPTPDNKRSRDFGPDAAPFSRRNKGKNSSRSERAPKGPMRENVRGQFFGSDDDEDDDFYDEELNQQDAETNLDEDEGNTKQ